MEPFVTYSTTMQSGRSTCRSNLPTLGLPCQLTCTVWPAFMSHGHKGLTQFLYSSFHTFVSENHHEQVSSPFATPCHAPKHAASQAATLVGTLQEHTIQSLDKTSQTPLVRRRQTSISLVPSQECWRSTEFRRTRVSGQQETQISNNYGTLQHSTRISTTVDGKNR